MAQYLLGIWQPGRGEAPPPEVLEPIVRDLAVVRRAMDEAGVWVFSGGLHGPDSSTVVRVRDGETVMTDGPFAEGKEFLGGFTIVDVPDLDAALDWGRRLSEATTLPVEVRPFH
ncbi:MAG TPA: YciI family protein [Pseudonocardiaceae bacterium]